MQPPPFEVVSGLEHTSHGAMALALAAEFDDVELDDVEAALFALAGQMRSIADAPDEHQLALVGDVLADELFVTVRAATTLDDLLFHRVAISGRGQGMVCALVAVEAARIAGVPLGIVASKGGVYVAHARASAPLVLVPTRGWLAIDARELDDPDLAWHCPHESAGIVLGIVLSRARRIGLLDVQLRAAQMCMALPVDEDEHDKLKLQLAHVRARLN